MKLFYFLSALIFFSISQSACRSQKKGTDQSNCSNSGIVTDFSELDGCQLLILMPDGKKLLPAKINDTNFVLQAGQNISFDYKELDAMASICMTEDKTIEITCISLIKENRPHIPTCHDIKENPTAVNWMKEAILKHRPEQISKYKYRTDGWAYLFTGKVVYLYDCQGTLICEAQTNEECLRFVEYGSRGKLIWQGEGIPD